MVGDESPQRRWTKKSDIVVVRLGERSGSFAHHDASSGCALVVTCVDGGKGTEEEIFFKHFQTPVTRVKQSRKGENVCAHN
jgi:hypothetical protein